MQIEIFKNAAAHIGADIRFITDNPISGQIIFPNDEKAYFLRSDLGLNSMATGELVQNKYLCGEVLRGLGFHSPETLKVNFGSDTTFNERQFSNTTNDEISEFIEKHGFPLFFKPNIGTEGAGVYKIQSFEQLAFAIEQLKHLPAAILQKPCIGDQEYRVMVLDGRIELAYRREPFEIIGDGIRTIDNLLDMELTRLSAKGGEITLDVKDTKIDFELAAKGFTRSTIPFRGQKINPLANVNLSEGAIPIECTAQIKAHFSNICEGLYKELGISYFGMDLMVDWSTPEPDYDIIEINRRPGFANFAAFSPQNKLLVQGVINRAFEALAKKNGYNHLAALFGLQDDVKPFPLQPAI